MNKVDSFFHIRHFDDGHYEISCRGEDKTVSLNFAHGQPKDDLDALHLFERYVCHEAAELLKQDNKEWKEIKGSKDCKNVIHQVFQNLDRSMVMNLEPSHDIGTHKASPLKNEKLREKVQKIAKEQIPSESTHKGTGLKGRISGVYKAHDLRMAKAYGGKHKKLKTVLATALKVAVIAAVIIPLAGNPYALAVAAGIMASVLLVHGVARASIALSCYLKYRPPDGASPELRAELLAKKIEMKRQLNSGFSFIMNPIGNLTGYLALKMGDVVATLGENHGMGKETANWIRFFSHTTATSLGQYCLFTIGLDLPFPITPTQGIAYGGIQLFEQVILPEYLPDPSTGNVEELQNQIERLEKIRDTLEEHNPLLEDIQEDLSLIQDGLSGEQPMTMGELSNALTELDQDLIQLEGLDRTSLPTEVVEEINIDAIRSQITTTKFLAGLAPEDMDVQTATAQPMIDDYVVNVVDKISEQQAALADTQSQIEQVQTSLPDLIRGLKSAADLQELAARGIELQGTPQETLNYLTRLDEQLMNGGESMEEFQEALANVRNLISGDDLAGFQSQIQSGISGISDAREGINVLRTVYQSIVDGLKIIEMVDAEPTTIIDRFLDTVRDYQNVLKELSPEEQEQYRSLISESIGELFDDLKEKTVNMDGVDLERRMMELITLQQVEEDIRRDQTILFGEEIFR